MKPRSWLIMLLVVCLGCVRTEVTRTAVSTVEGAPYHKLLVCSLSDDLTTAATVESFLMDALKKNHVETDNCTRLLYPLREASPDQALAALQKKAFDGILVTQREAVASARNPEASIKEQFNSEGDFVAIYLAKRRKQDAAAAPPDTGATEEVVLQPYGRERFVYARAALLASRENQTVWTAGGIVKGSVETPSTAFMQSFAETTEGELRAAGLIPSSTW